MLEGHLGELQMDSDGLQYRDFYKVRHMGVCILAPPFREHSVSVLLRLLTLCWSIILYTGASVGRKEVRLGIRLDTTQARVHTVPSQPWLEPTC
jgi:hypothetical protein